MGNKKRKTGPTLEETLERPFCYYCERDFDDLKILISHQRARHFKCPRCNRRLNTAGGLSVHLHQVHKESLKEIDNALPNRADPNLEIFGMEGIPEDVMNAHKARVTDAYFQSEEGQKAAANGQTGGSNPKRAKVEMETPEQIKARLEKHRAQKRLEKEFGKKDASPLSEHSAPPSQAPASPVPPPSQPPAVPVTANSAFSPHSMAGFPPPVSQYPYGVPLAGSPQPPPYGSPAYPPPGGAIYPGHDQTIPRPPYPSANSPIAPASASRPHLPARAPSLPAASPISSSQAIPGLPQRPNFNSPHLSKEHMAQMHSPTSGATFVQSVVQTRPSNGSLAQTNQNPSTNSTDIGNMVDDPGRSVNDQQGDQTLPDTHGLPTKVNPDGSTNGSVTANPKLIPQGDDRGPAQATLDSKRDKKGKKGKDNAGGTLLIYSDNIIAPEEKMARLGKYQPNWNHGNAPETILGEAGDAVTGALGETVRDPQD